MMKLKFICYSITISKNLSGILYYTALLGLENDSTQSIRVKCRKDEFEVGEHYEFALLQP